MKWLQAFDEVTSHVRECLSGTGHWLFATDDPDAHAEMARFAFRLLAAGADDGPDDVCVATFEYFNTFTGLRTGISLLTVPKSTVGKEAVVAFVTGTTPGVDVGDRDLFVFSPGERGVYLAGILAQIKDGKTWQKPPVGAN